MGTSSSSLNSKGFSDSISSGFIPQSDHITYDGVFNELKFLVGKQATQLVQIFCIEGKDKIKDQKFLGLFLKSCMDGKPRTSNLHAVLVLDISGSMGGLLSKKNQSKVNRLELAKIATKKFIYKLNDQDSFSIITFNTKAHTLFPLTKKATMNIQAVFEIIDDISVVGGTNLQQGFKEGEKVFKIFRQNNQNLEGEQRIIMLTDVCNNMSDNNFVMDLQKSQIHTTIIGISYQFRSDTCQKLKMIKGFNYFCAIQNNDLDTHLVDHFNYTFFPCAYDLKLQIQSNCLNSFQVYGTPDRQKVKTYNNFADIKNTNFVITKMQSLFPSELKKNAKDQVIMDGGLILMKIKIKDIYPFVGRINYNYKDHFGKQWRGEVQICSNFEQSENESLREAIGGYCFVRDMKNIIQKMNSKQYKLNDGNRMEYIEQLKSLQDISPKSKIKDIQNMIKVVQQYHDPN